MESIQIKTRDHMLFHLQQYKKNSAIPENHMHNHGIYPNKNKETTCYSIYSNTRIQNNSHKWYTTIMHQYTTDYSSVRSKDSVQNLKLVCGVTDRGATLIIEKEKKTFLSDFPEFRAKLDMTCTCTID
jgi:hypothetical protein